MKRFIKAYTSFTRTEKLGIIVLLSVLLLLIIIRTTMNLWVQPHTNAQQEQQLAAAWEKYKEQNKLQNADDTTEQPSELAQTVTSSTLIDLNTADSLTLIDLKGIGPKIAHRILEHRRTEGKFTSLNQLREVYHFPAGTLAYLKTQLTIK